MAAASSCGSVFKQPQPVNPNNLPFFSRISEDILVNVFVRLEQDPRDLARLACVCRRFKNAIRTTCWRHQCMRVVPAVVSELMSHQQQQYQHNFRDLIGEPPGGWGSLQKLLVCCPGLRHAGVLLESWDFGLERELGNSEEYFVVKPVSPDFNQEVDIVMLDQGSKRKKVKDEVVSARIEGPIRYMKKGGLHYHNKVMQDQRIVSTYRRTEPAGEDTIQRVSDIQGEQPLEEFVGDACNDSRAHLAKGSWSLTREQGNKLLASRLSPNPTFPQIPSCIENCIQFDACLLGSSLGNIGAVSESSTMLVSVPYSRVSPNYKCSETRFRDDSLFICDWPGCCHQGEKRIYKLFRGIFKNFKQSHVWRNLKDQGCKDTDLACSYCSSRKTYDMVTSFCLRRSLEYHEDGEPVVRAYVCENGHVAGAWTDRPLYNM